MRWWRVAVSLVGILVIAAGPAVPGADAELICRKKKGQLLARTACKAKETPLDVAALLDLPALLVPGDGLALAGNTLGIADGGVGAAKIAPGAVTADAVADHTRSLFFPSTSLSFSDTMSDPFLRIDLGLQVSQHAMGMNGNPPAAVLLMPRPLDYDGTSTVVAHLYLVFNYGTNPDNIVLFRIKAHAVDLGQGLANAGWTDADAAVTVTGGYQVLRQTFTLDASDTSPEIWYLQFGRGDALNGQTYSNPITIAGLEIQYTAVQ